MPRSSSKKRLREETQSRSKKKAKISKSKPPRKDLKRKRDEPQTTNKRTKKDPRPVILSDAKPIAGSPAPTSTQGSPARSPTRRKSPRKLTGSKKKKKTAIVLEECSLGSLKVDEIPVGSIRLPKVRTTPKSTPAPAIVFEEIPKVVKPALLAEMETETSEESTVEVKDTMAHAESVFWMCGWLIFVMEALLLLQVPDESHEKFINSSEIYRFLDRHSSHISTWLCACVFHVVFQLATRVVPNDYFKHLRVVRAMASVGFVFPVVIVILSQDWGDQVIRFVFERFTHLFWGFMVAEFFWLLRIALENLNEGFEESTRFIGHNPRSFLLGISMPLVYHLLHKQDESLWYTFSTFLGLHILGGSLWVYTLQRQFADFGESQEKISSLVQLGVDCVAVALTCVYGFPEEFKYRDLLF